MGTKTRIGACGTKKINLWSLSYFWHMAPKTLGIYRGVKVFFVCWDDCWLESLYSFGSPERPNHVTRELEVSAPPPTSGERRGIRDWVQSMMANVFFETLNSGVQRTSMWWTHQGVGRVMCLREHWSSNTRTHVHTCPQYFALCLSSIWLFLSCVHYNKLVIRSKALPWIHSSELSNLREVVGTPSLYPSSESEVQMA